MTPAMRSIKVMYGRRNGKQVAFPKSEDAHLFCSLVGSDVLTSAQLELISELNFQIEEFKRPALALVSDVPNEVDEKMEAIVRIGRSIEAQRAAWLVQWERRRTSIRHEMSRHRTEQAADGGESASEFPWEQSAKSIKAMAVKMAAQIQARKNANVENLTLPQVLQLDGVETQDERANPQRPPDLASD